MLVIAEEFRQIPEERREDPISVTEASAVLVPSVPSVVSSVITPSSSSHAVPVMAPPTSSSHAPAEMAPSSSSSRAPSAMTPSSSSSHAPANVALSSSFHAAHVQPSPVMCKCSYFDSLCTGSSISMSFLLCVQQHL